MTQDQIQRLEETIRYENDKIHVALIADSPWIPGYCGDTFIDYYARNEVFIAGNRKIRKDFPDAIFVPSWWVEYGMAAEPTGFGCPTCFFEDNLPHMYPLIEDLGLPGSFLETSVCPIPRLTDLCRLF